MQQISSSSNSSQHDTRNLFDDLFRVLGILRRGWKLIAVAIVVCMAMATVHLARSKPVYSASARVLVLQQGGRPLSVAGAADPLQMNSPQDLLATHLIIIRSPVIVERALESAGLRGISTQSVLAALKVHRPDESANVFDLSYDAETRDEAVRVVEAVVESYKKFIKENYQQNANEVVSFISEARDGLGQDLKELETPVPRIPPREWSA